MSDTIVCELCGTTFTSTWTEEEALAELKEVFGDVSIEVCDIVCEDCYQELCEEMGWQQLN